MKETRFTYLLSDNEQAEVIAFLESRHYYSMLQNPHWDNAINSHKSSCYCIVRQKGAIVAYALVSESYVVARLLFGPVGVDAESIARAITDIRNYYLKKGFARLEVQLGIPSGQLSEEIEYAVFKEIIFRQAISPENWTSIEVPLALSPEALLQSFSTHHKRSIAKAQKAGLKTKLLADLEAIREFSLLYDQMYKSRRLAPPFPDSFEAFTAIFRFFQKDASGVFAGVYDTEGNLCGGACFSIQSDFISYQYGCTLQNTKLPILHLAFFVVMKHASALNLRCMDLCGVNLLVKEADQIYQINRFKMGFTGKIVYYPRKMVFTLNAWKGYLYDTAKFCIQKIGFNEKRFNC